MSKGSLDDAQKQRLGATPIGDGAFRWHLVFTKPANEETALANLERQGYRVYFPRLQQKVLRKGAWRDTVSALFPRYLFVQLTSAMQSLAPLRSTLGVANVVRFGGEYVAVPDSVVNGLIDSEDEAGMHRLAVDSVFKPGLAVRVIRGAFAGIEGIFERHDSNERVVLLLSLLGRDALIKVSSGSVIPAT